MLRQTALVSVIGVAALGAMVGPVLGQSAAQGVWVELQSEGMINPDLPFVSHMERVISGAEVASFADDLTPNDIRSISHACNRIQVAPAAYLPESVQFCDYFDDVVRDIQRALEN